MVYSNSGPKKIIISALIIITLTTGVYVYFGEPIKEFLQEKNLLSQLLKPSENFIQLFQNTIVERYGVQINLNVGEGIFFNEEDFYEVQGQLEVIDLLGFRDLIIFLAGDQSQAEQDLGFDLTLQNLRDELDRQLLGSSSSDNSAAGGGGVGTGSGGNNGGVDDDDRRGGRGGSDGGSGSNDSTGGGSGSGGGGTGNNNQQGPSGPIASTAEDAMFNILKEISGVDANGETFTLIMSQMETFVIDESQLYSLQGSLLNMSALRKFLADQGVTVSTAELEAILEEVYQRSLTPGLPPQASDATRSNRSYRANPSAFSNAVNETIDRHNKSPRANSPSERRNTLRDLLDQLSQEL